MKHLCHKAVEDALTAGASYADIRIVSSESENILVRNGRIARLNKAEDMGFGVRVIKDGAWGFASSNIITRENIEKVVKRAVETAQSSAALKREDIILTDEPAYQDTWSTTCLINPFKIPLSDKVDLLMAADKILRIDDRIKSAESSMNFRIKQQYLCTSEGTFIDQRILWSGGGISATAVKDGDVQRRTYPSSFGGQFMTLGWELIESLKFEKNAERIREEAVALLSADPCLQKTGALIINGEQLALQIHESVGHATELDRALGMESNFAGDTFATTEKLGNFRYGSDIVNLVCDSTIPGGMATMGYDDDGVRAQRWNLVKDGMFIGYQTNRALAHKIGQNRSSGNNRADGWNNIPMIRITNLSLEPGEWNLDDMIADTDDGIMMSTNRSWSIDQRRLNFQFGCEIGWEVKNGKKTRMLKNPSYQGITPEFWGSCDAICNRGHWILWGLVDCGKGQPMQTVEMSHGAAPSRFRNVKMGIMG